jgi:chromosome partitioning protein
MSAQAREAAEGLGLPVLASTLGLRKALVESLAAGKGVASYEPKSDAAEEVRALFDEIIPRDPHPKRGKKEKSK